MSNENKREISPQNSLNWLIDRQEADIERIAVNGPDESPRDAVLVRAIFQATLVEIKFRKIEKSKSNDH